MRQSFLNLMDQIVVEEFTDSKDLYEIDKEILFNKYCSPNFQESYSGPLQAGGIIIEILEYVLAFATTYEFIVKLKKLFTKEHNEEQLCIEWYDALVKAGLDKQKAKRVSIKFYKDLKKIIED